MTKRTPITLVGLLAGGVLTFSLNAYFPVPIEGWFALIGIITFLAGMAFGLFGTVRGIATLTNSKSRAQTGVYIPIIVILITVCTFIHVIRTMLFVKESLDQRSELENEHWDELYKDNSEKSQPLDTPNHLAPSA